MKNVWKVSLPVDKDLTVQRKYNISVTNKLINHSPPPYDVDGVFVDIAVSQRNQKSYYDNNFNLFPTPTTFAVS